MDQENLTEDEATFVLLSVSYALACATGNDVEALKMLEHIVCTGSKETLIGMSSSILKKLDVKVIKPINSITC